MTEIDVTRLVEETNPHDFSGSIATHGANAARETWGRALEEARGEPLLQTVADVEGVRDYFREFGTWDDAEVDGWSEDEVAALAIQYVSGDLKEATALAPGDGPGCIDWDAYRELQSEGTCSSVLFLGAGDRVFADFSN